MENEFEDCRKPPRPNTKKQISSSRWCRFSYINLRCGNISRPLRLYVFVAHVRRDVCMFMCIFSNRVRTIALKERWQHVFALLCFALPAYLPRLLRWLYTFCVHNISAMCAFFDAVESVVNAATTSYKHISYFVHLRDP